MRKLVLALVSVVLLASCTKRGAKIAGAGFGIGSIGTLTFSSLQFYEASAPVTVVVAVSGLVTTLVGGAVMYWGMGAGIKGFLTTEERPAAVAVVVDPQAVARDRARAQAWELTKGAAAAARSEDCARVKTLEPEVRGLDTDFYASVFVRDVAIVRCLGM